LYILRNKGLFRILLIFLFLALVMTFSACSKEDSDPEKTEQPVEKEKPTLVFADAGWDSIQFHNYVAQLIVENGFGYKTDTMSGSTPITVAGLIKGDIDIYMEMWTTNVAETYYPAIDSGEVVELSTNFDDNAQGLYVPTYMIKGDSERGIAPMAPELKNIMDLPKYWELFKDPEGPSKGRIFGAIPGWAVDAMLSEKLINYGINDTYNYVSPGSDTALATSMVKAYEKGEPWVGYYWEPTWIMGKLDMTLLEDEKYSDELWNDGYRSEFPPVPCTVAVHKDIPEIAPDVVDFLKNYETSSALTSEALAYMQDNEVTPLEAAKWFLQEHEELWTKWVSAEVADKVKTAVR